MLRDVFAVICWTAGAATAVTLLLIIIGSVRHRLIERKERAADDELPPLPADDDTVTWVTEQLSVDINVTPDMFVSEPAPAAAEAATDTETGHWSAMWGELHEGPSAVCRYCSPRRTYEDIADTDVIPQVEEPLFVTTVWGMDAKELTSAIYDACCRPALTA